LRRTLVHLGSDAAFAVAEIEANGDSWGHEPGRSEDMNNDEG